MPAAVEELVGGKWAQEDVLPLNGTPEEVQQLREHMLLQRAAAKAKKERKKAGKLQAAAVDIVAGTAYVVPVQHSVAAHAAGMQLPICRLINFDPGKGKYAIHMWGLRCECMQCGSSFEHIPVSLVGATGTAGRKRGDAEMGSLADEKAQAKKFKATETAPKLASKAVWASIFTSSRPEEKETYGCRALSSRGLA